jgi:uncharacterized protein DUF4255
MLLDVSLVTQTLVSLIDKHIRASPAGAGIVQLKVSAEPREELTGPSTVSIYLYHITEEAHYKNAAAVSADLPPIRFTPMGLNLFYQLTAHSDTADDPGIFKEQLLTGLAMKALRDFPVIDDSTEIGGLKVFPVDLQGTDNRFRITLQPIPPTESVSFWAPGKLPMRLAAYYQASVVLLEPEKSVLRPGRVLKYSIFTFTRGAPRLDGSQATVTFTIPGETSPTTVESQPAEVSIRNLVTNSGGEIRFIGSDLTGDATTLLIKNKLFTEPEEVGLDWGVTATEGQIFAAVHPTAGLKRVLPGIYSAIAKVTTQRLGADNKIRIFNKTSNEAPFIVTPRIDNISAPDPAGVVTVTGTTFQDPDIAIDSVELFVGPNKISLKAAAALNVGEFEVVNPTTLRFRYPIAGINSGETVPFRLIVNGAESAPNWVLAP